MKKLSVLLLILFVPSLLIAAAGFGGSDAYTTGTTNWPTSNGDRTFSMWIYTTDTSTRQELLYYGGESTNQRFLVDIYATGKIEVSFLGGSVLSSAALSNNTWHHVAITAGTSACEVFIDGSSVGSGTPSINTGSATGHIAGNLGAIANLTGRMAEIAVWNVKLSSTDIAVLAKGFTPQKIRPDVLIWYAPLIRDTTILKGSGSFSASAGSPSVADHPRIYK